jgi:hypothetical protein
MARVNALRPVNFVRNVRGYDKVQDQIFGLIREALGDHPISETQQERRDDAINFGLFIRIGRHANAVPMPIDVLMSHGLADKNYLISAAANGKRLINAYEHVIVPGQWFVDRLAHRRWHPLPSGRVTLRTEQIHIAGWPRLDPLFREQKAQGSTSHRPLRVLWAPSHNVSSRARSFSSFPVFEQFLPALQEKFDVRVSLHPANRTDKSPTTGDLTWADVVVSDFGTMLYEAFALNKCVIMPTWLLPPQLWRDRRERLSAEGHIYAKRIGNHAQSLDDLIAIAERNEPPGEDVQRFMTRILAPEYAGRSALRVAELLKTLPVRRLFA